MSLPTVRVLRSDDLSSLQSLVAQAPVRHAWVASRIENSSDTGVIARNFLGAFDHTGLVSALMLGANIVPISTTPQTRRMFADQVSSAWHSCSSLVGHADEVLDLWGLLEPQWGAAREVRDSQPFMTIAHPSTNELDERVRYSTLADFELLLPACIAMFTEEVGVSPVQNGATAYRQRVSEIVSSRRSFIRLDGDEIVFKAEVSSVGNDVAQLQGVWVNPRYRGLGLAAPAIAAVVRLVLQDMASVVALYANSYNAPALAAYRRVGFTQTDTFATVLL